MLKKNLGLLQTGRVVKDIAMLETGLRKVVEASWVSTPVVCHASSIIAAEELEVLYGLSVGPV